MAEEGVSRRDFLKTAGTSIAGCLLRKPIEKVSQWTDKAASNATPVLEFQSPGLEIEKRIHATQVPIIEYHYPGYTEAGIVETKESVIAQMDFLKREGYQTVTDVQLASFLDSGTALQAKSVAIRIDQGATHFEEFEEFITILETNGFSATVYLTSGENFTDTQWQQLATWKKTGVIGIGSRSVDHPDFKKISETEAYDQALHSKKIIEERLAQFDVQTEVISFAFPHDSVPDNIDFLRRAKYKFALGGPSAAATDNAAKRGQYLLPSIHPYVSTATLGVLKANKHNNPLSVYLANGLPFDKMMLYNSSPITVNHIMEATHQNCEPALFGNYTELPYDPDLKGRLTRPVGIIIHTADQGATDFPNWTSTNTYNGLKGREVDVHLGVGLDGISQYLPMYKDGFVTPARRAIGFGNWINIELSGRLYDDVVNPNADPERVKAITKITGKAVKLIEQLIKMYPWINAETDILGHYEASAEGKTDPGDLYMDKYLRPILKQYLNKS